MTIQPIVLSDLTTATTSGSGVFDVLMRSHKEHLEQEFNKGRIKGPEYSTVYLGSLQAVLQSAIAFLLQKDKTALEAQLVEKQIELAEVEKQIKGVELQIAQANLAKIPVELAILEAQKDIAEKQVLKVPAEIALLGAQTALAEQQALKVPADIALVNAQKEAVENEATKTAAEVSQIEAQTRLTDAQASKATSEIALTTAQTSVATAQASKIPSDKSLVDQQVLNAEKENAVLIAQECKLRAEYDVLMETKAKTAEEKNVLMWKATTEKAQTTSVGVDDNSIIGKQKILYTAQADGFKRDAEQKAAKAVIEAWSIQRTTDSATSTAGTNLDNSSVGRAVSKMLSGVGA